MAVGSRQCASHGWRTLQGIAANGVGEAWGRGGGRVGWVRGGVPGGAPSHGWRLPRYLPRPELWLGWVGGIAWRRPPMAGTSHDVFFHTIHFIGMISGCDADVST